MNVLAGSSRFKKNKSIKDAEDMAINTKKKDKSQSIFIFLMLLWPMIHWLTFTLLMNIQTVVYSFQKINKFTGQVRFAGLENYIELFEKIFRNLGSWGTAFRNTFLWLGVNVLIVVPLSLIIAYFLSKKIPFYRFFNTVLFIPNIISIVILTMVWSFVWGPTQGIVNTLLELLGLGKYTRIWLGDPKTALLNIFLYKVWAGIGFNNLILSGAIAKIPREVLEAAEIDGTSNWQEFFHIIIPSIWPTISTLTILGATGAFTIFLIPDLLTGGQYGTTTITLKIVNEVLAGGSYGMASAAGITIGVCGFLVVYLIKLFLDRMEEKWS